MAMADKVQREIEELLDKLDNFVPEERFTSKMRDRRRQERAAARSGPSPADRLAKRFSGITLGHLMLAGFVLLLAAAFFDGPLGAATRYVFFAGIILAGAAFVLTMMNRGRGSHTPVMKSRPGRSQKVWRGQVIEYDDEPSTLGRLRDRFRRRGRP
jgi:hypothetical protein